MSMYESAKSKYNQTEFKGDKFKGMFSDAKAKVITSSLRYLV